MALELIKIRKAHNRNVTQIGRQEFLQRSSPHFIVPSRHIKPVSSRSAPIAENDMKQSTEEVDEVHLWGNQWVFENGLPSVCRAKIVTIDHKKDVACRQKIGIGLQKCDFVRQRPSASSDGMDCLVDQFSQMKSDCIGLIDLGATLDCAVAD